MFSSTDSRAGARTSGGADVPSDSDLETEAGEALVAAGRRYTIDLDGYDSHRTRTVFDYNPRLSG